ncbi:MAG: hypothetical protein ACRCWY_11870 [Cellulosilyticaceae bacterium]
MMFITQCILLIIALGIFKLQHRLKKRMRLEVSKLIYWTSVLFISVTFNSILYGAYPEHYNMLGYLNVTTLIFILLLIIGSVVIQSIAPATSFKRYWKKHRQKTDEEVERQVDEQEAPVNVVTYVEELGFESFVETLCMLAVASVMVLQGGMTLLGQGMIQNEILGGLQSISILLMMLTLPIAIRQIIFYLYHIKRVKKEAYLPEVELAFQQKLKKEHTSLF